MATATVRRDPMLLARRVAAVLALALVAAVPLVRTEPAAPPRQVLTLYFDYLRSFRHNRAYYLLTDSHRSALRERGEAASEWLYSPGTPLATPVWSLLEIQVGEERREPTGAVSLDVRLLDYVSGRQVDGRYVLVRTGHRWEIAGVEYSAVRQIGGQPDGK